MTQIATHGLFAPGLSTRGPVSSVLEECLRAQLDAGQRSAIASFIGVSPLNRAARSRYRDALEERRSDIVFSRLGTEFTVLHTLATEAGADHLVIGPPGLFAVTTRSFSTKRIRVGGARFMVNGRKKGCVTTARRDAAQVSGQFSEIAGAHIDVTPLIVVVEPRSLSLSTPEVAVTESAKVARWFAGLPRVLSDETITYLRTVAELPGDWQLSVEASDDAERHAQRFERLRREVEAAKRRAHHCLFVCLSVMVGGGAVAAVALSGLIGG
jgi:hypothetical protein